MNAVPSAAGPHTAVVRPVESTAIWGKSLDRFGSDIATGFVQLSGLVEELE
jgi:hypothetical protein